MKNSFDAYNWHNNLHVRWIVLPVLAYMLSWIGGWAGILLFFPVLVTVAQYLILTIHPAIARPGFWFFTLPITFFIWVKWGPALMYAKPNGIVYGVAAYYGGQLINTLFIPLISRKEKANFLLNWIIGNLVAGTAWLVLHNLSTTIWSADKSVLSREFGMYVIYPAIALLSNYISSFFFTRKLLQD